MDRPLSADAYQGAEPTCCSTVFSPSPDWAKQTEDSTNVKWQVVHPSETQTPRLLSMVSFRILEFPPKLLYFFSNGFLLTIYSFHSSTCMFLIVQFSCLSVPRPAFHSTQAQKQPCGSSFCRTEIFPSYSKTKGFPCTWSHLVKFPFNTLLSC